MCTFSPAMTFPPNNWVLPPPWVRSVHHQRPQASLRHKGSGLQHKPGTVGFLATIFAPLHLCAPSGLPATPPPPAGRPSISAGPSMGYGWRRFPPSLHCVKAQLSSPCCRVRCGGIPHPLPIIRVLHQPKCNPSHGVFRRSILRKQ